MPRTQQLVVITLVAVAALAGGALVAFVAGADAVSLVLGGAMVAAAFSVVVGAWLRPVRSMRRERRRADRQAERNADRRARRTRKAVHGAERRLFHQLEALSWLQAELDLATPLPPTRGTAASPDALLELVRLIDRLGARTVLETGSGVSTIVMGRRLQQIGSGRLVALEHMPEYAAATRAEIAAHGLEAHATVLDAPLVDHVIGDATWSWYELSTEVPNGIDLLFVDGPPERTGRLARYPALPLLRDRLTPGATALIDDGSRRDEWAMVGRWADEFEGLQVQELPLAKGAWLLTLPSTGAPA